MKARVLAILRFPSMVEWFLLVVGLVLAWRYFWVMDDAYIYFRYVDNLLFLDRGLVYNAGEYVEGFTSPLWTLVLIAVRTTTLSYWTLVFVCMVLFWLAFWAAAVRINRRLSPEGPTVNFPLAFAAGCYGLLTYLSSGLETPLVQLTGVAFALAFLEPRSRIWHLLIGLAPILRHELVIPLTVWGAWFLFRFRRPPWVAIATAVVTLLGWLLFRIIYYAELFPNTFYLKDEANWRQGYNYLKDSNDAYHFTTALVVLAVMALACWSRDRGRGLAGGFEAGGRHIGPLEVRGMMLLTALTSLIYTARVGGDFMHYRFLAFPVCLGALACGGIVESFFRFLDLGRTHRFVAPIVSILLVAGSFTSQPVQLRNHPVGSIKKTRKNAAIDDANWYRSRKDLIPSLNQLGESRRQFARYRKATDAQRKHDGVVTGGWSVALYRKFDKFVIHDWGLTDPVLARIKMKSDRPGHKSKLHRYARSVARVHRHARDNRGPGMYRRAVKARQAPKWIRRNLPQIELLEKKIYNRHSFGENLRLAFGERPVIIP